MATKGIYSLKIVQLNIWQGRFLRDIIKYLSEEQPDVMCLQEVYSSKLDSPQFPFFSSLEHIQAIFPEYYVYFSPVYDFTILEEKVGAGNAILSKFPLENTETLFINGEHTSPKNAAGLDTNARNLQRVTVRISDGSSFCLINHHGYWEPSAVGSQISIDKMQKVADIITASPRPLLCAGDFNIASYSPAMQPIKELLKDLTEAYKLTTTLSPFGAVSDVPCDHICISDGIQVKSFRAETAHVVSDHLALVLECEIA